MAFGALAAPAPPFAVDSTFGAIANVCMIVCTRLFAIIAWKVSANAGARDLARARALAPEA
jgi:hypothetical protein